MERNNENFEIWGEGLVWLVFVCLVGFETLSSVAQAVFQLSTLAMVTLNSQFSCLLLPSARIRGVYHYAWIGDFYNPGQCSC